MSPSTKVQNDDALLAEALAFAYDEELAPVDAPPPPRGKKAEPGTWTPDINPQQQRIFDDPADNVLGHGEKGSGKTIGFGHKIIRHAWENDNALVLIIAPSMRTGNEGIWHDLETLILPQWKDGIGLEYTAAKLDPNTKDRHRWIKNRFGGWSKLLLMSIPYASQVQARVKGPAPSMVYVDELTQCDGPEYYTFTAAQLGRRRGIIGPQQFCASCNPDGPSHWVYQVFFVDCVDKDTGKRDAAYSVYHVPITENRHRLPAGYVERLEKIFKADPIEKRRLIDGEWIDRATGDGLFKEYLIPAIHIRGDKVKGHGLLPSAGWPIIIGYDLGQVYSSVTFLQSVATKDKVIWLVIDEIAHLKEKILYKRLAWEVIDRMRYWQKIGLPSNKGRAYEFQYMHVTDESAINQWRPGGDGSYDAWEFEREFNRVSDSLGNRKMKLLGCPKGEGSVAARVRMVQSKLYQEEIFISAICKHATDMLYHLEADDKNPENPKRSKFIHLFDSLSYPIFKLEMAGGINKYLPTKQIAPTLTRCGIL